MPGVPLAPGWHAWVWPLPDKARDLTARATAARLAEVAAAGGAGVILQDGLTAPAWVGPPKERRELHQRARDLGLQVTIGLGLDGSEGYRDNPERAADAILAALDAAPAVMLNWEIKWSDPAGRERAERVVSRVLAQCPGSDTRCVDAPWWAPRTVRRRTARGRWVERPTHPSAPTREFGRLCRDRFVQAYGANVPGSPDGASANMLEWSRDPSQYPALGTPADRVRPALQMYHRTVTDHVRTLLADPVAALWHWDARDDSARHALAVVAALARVGYRGPGADRRFQSDQGIPGPELWGPRASAALGVVPPAPLLVQWYRR